MADEDQDASRPNLEPPKLFGRKRRPDDASEPELELPPEPDATPEADPEPEPEPVLDLPPEPDPAAERYSDPTWMFELPDEPESRSQPDARPAAKSEPVSEPEPEPATAVLPAEGGAPLFADEVEPKETEPEEADPTPTKARRPRKPKAPRSRPNLPTVSGWVAAAITGVVTGLLLVGMTAGSLQGCEAVRGTSTCGGAGVVLLILIMAILIALGGFLLRVFNVPDPTSTSFLALGMVAVISLLFLLEVMENWWIAIVIPVVSAAMYLLGYWVTTAFVEPAKEPAEK